MTSTKAHRDRKYARNFGPESDAVRAAPCLLLHLGACVPRTIVVDDEERVVSDPAHVVSVGADGGRFDLVSLCNFHHRRQHHHGIVTFAGQHGLDLRALADAVALAHEPPLGIRGLAERWAWWASYDPPQAKNNEELDAHLDGLGSVPRVVQDYDLAALLGCVRRRMAADDTLDHAIHQDRDGLADIIADDLDIPDAWELCEQAGWPS